MEKLEWCSYLTVKKSENMFTHFDTICNVTDRHQTTAQAALMHSIAQQQLNLTTVNYDAFGS